MHAKGLRRAKNSAGRTIVAWFLPYEQCGATVIGDVRHPAPGLCTVCTMKPIRTFLALLLVCFSLLSNGLYANAEDPGCFNRSYQWKLDGLRYTLDLDLPWTSYDFYTAVPRVYGEYGVYSYEHPAHAIVPELVARLQDIAADRCLSEWGLVRLCVSFVQHLRYQPEPGEYPKYPMETLGDRGGDCEDLSILAAAMFRELGFATKLINPPGHMALALACKNCDGQFYEWDGRKYFYVETTAQNYEVGMAPARYERTLGNVFSTDLAETALGYLQTMQSPAIVQHPLYYVREDAHIHRVAATRPWVAVGKSRTMTLLGEQSSSNELLGIGDNDSAIQPPLAWAAQRYQKQVWR